MTFDAPCTQARFGELVGISQQAVSDLVSRNVLKPGDTAAAWLLNYCAHLREQAAGRGADGELAYQRSELARISRERNEIKLALERRQYAPVSLIEQVLAHVGRRIVSVLEPLPQQLHQRAPELSSEALKIIQTEVARACDIAATTSLAALTADDDEAQADDADDEGLDEDHGDFEAQA